MRKKYLLISLLFIAVGFAAVTTNLVINGTSIIKKNADNFKVYYSDALVNGNQDLSVVVDDTHLSFKTTLDTLGQIYVLDYDVTNSSKIYDAQLTMNCTGGNEYLTVVNSFDTVNNLLATNTRRGKLTLTLAKSYSGADMDVEIVCTLGANAVERNSEATGTPAAPVEPVIPQLYEIGDNVKILDEEFNVIEEDDTTVTLLAKYNLSDSFRQTQDINYDEFSSEIGWEYTPGPKEIDIQQYDGPSKYLVNGYTDYLKGVIGDETLTGNLITLKQLETLGCNISQDYTNSSFYGYSCDNSLYKEWIANGQHWWTRSAIPTSDYLAWYVDGDAYLQTQDTTFMYDDNYGVRPIITISKNKLMEYLNPVVDAQTFCENKGFTYGIDNVANYCYSCDFIETGDISKAAYLCSNYVDFDEEVYGYDKDGVEVYYNLFGLVD